MISKIKTAAIVSFSIIITGLTIYLGISYFAEHDSIPKNAFLSYFPLYLLITFFFDKLCNNIGIAVNSIDNSKFVNRLEVACYALSNSGLFILLFFLKYHKWGTTLYKLDVLKLEAPANDYIGLVIDALASVDFILEWIVGVSVVLLLFVIPELIFVDWWTMQAGLLFLYQFLAKKYSLSIPLIAVVLFFLIQVFLMRRKFAVDEPKGEEIQEKEQTLTSIKQLTPYIILLFVGLGLFAYCKWTKKIDSYLVFFSDFLRLGYSDMEDIISEQSTNAAVTAYFSCFIQLIFSFNLLEKKLPQIRIWSRVLNPILSIIYSVVIQSTIVPFLVEHIWSIYQSGVLTFNIPELWGQMLTSFDSFVLNMPLYVLKLIPFLLICLLIGLLLLIYFMYSIYTFIISGLVLSLGELPFVVTLIVFMLVNSMTQNFFGNFFHRVFQNLAHEEKESI